MSARHDLHRSERHARLDAVFPRDADAANRASFEKSAPKRIDSESEFPSLLSARTLAIAVLVVFLAAVASHFFPWGIT